MLVESTPARETSFGQIFRGSPGRCKDWAEGSCKFRNLRVVFRGKHDRTIPNKLTIQKIAFDARVEFLKSQSAIRV